MAPAKINLTLEVLGTRSDGYHDLASIFATVALWDRVRVAPSRTLDVRIAPDVGAPEDADLATMSVHALAKASARPAIAHIRVKKRIPVAAGLGGGSSDAAAVLRGLERVWRLNGVDLTGVGAAIGSDVPFFVSGAAFALVRGRGERVDPLPAPPVQFWISLVRVRERLSTAKVFTAHRGKVSSGDRTAALAAAFRGGVVTPATVRAHLGNDLLEAAERVAPEIASIRKTAAGLGIDLTMSGSGPSLFALADDRAHALRIARRLRRARLRARVLALGVAQSATSERGLSPYV
jgi:4-diphosphocytidyl-2-C-methyl-D-erythritol kinase